MQIHRTGLWMALLGAGLLAGLGCQTPKAGTPLTGQFGKDDPEAQLEFWHQLGDRPMTCNDDAFHGLLLYLDGKDASADYAERVQTLKTKKVLPESFQGAADDAIERGLLAVAIVQAAGLKGGLVMSVFGPSPRYAVRELQFEGIYPMSSPNQTFSGREYVGIIGRLEDYQRGNPADKPAAQLPGEDGNSEK